MVAPVNGRRSVAASLCVLGLALSACASSDVTGINAAAQDEIRKIQVSGVNVGMDTPKPNPRLQATLKEELESAMRQCAKGFAEHMMEVTITDFEDQDVGKAILMGDEIELEGRVEFVEVTTGETTGEYFVENSFAWGGVLGAAMMSDAERKLSRNFAESICEDLFETDLETASRG